MKQRQKLILVVGLILLGDLAFALFSFVGKKYFGFVYPYGSFCFFPGDRFMDFFNINQMVSGRRPYVDHFSSYPPLILAIAYAFTFISRLGDPNGNIRGFGDGMAYALFIEIFSAAIFVILYAVFSKQKGLFKNKFVMYAVMVTLVITAPFIYMFDRGNYLLACIALFLAYAYYYEENEMLSACFLGLAAAVKIYPLFFVLLYLIERKWKCLGVSLIVAGVSSALAMLVFDGGYIQNCKELIYALLNFGGGYENEVPNVYFAVGLTSVLRFPFVVWNDQVIPESFPIMKIYLVLGTILTLWSVWCMRNEQRFYKKLMVLTALMVFLTPNSYLYNLTYMMPAIVFYILGKPGQKKWVEGLYGIILALSMIPKTYTWYIPGSGVSIQVLIDGGLLLLLVLVYNLLDSGTRKKIKSKEAIE